MTKDLALLIGPDQPWLSTTRLPRQDRNNAQLKAFADTLERVCIQTVESGYMTKDLSLLIGPDQPWLSTVGFLDKIDENLRKAMG